MNLEIKSFANAGELAKERLILKALTDSDVGEYAVFRSGMNDNLPTAGRKMAYWFPDHEVKANDLIVLYTKSGAQSTKLLDDGHTAHFFYWGKEEALWGDKQFCAVVLAVSDFEFKVPGK